MKVSDPSCGEEGIGLDKTLARTRDYLARSEQRKSTLGEKLRELIPVGVPFVWEVGCGHGHFLTAYAKMNPEALCVGVDIVRDRIQRATRKANRARLTHLHFLIAEANDFLSMLPAEAELAAIYVLFPDPWPKRRHHKNRLMQAAFLDTLARRVGERTRLYFRTDFEPYFAEVVATLAAHPDWECIDEPWPFETETVFQARAATYFSLVARRKA